MFLTACEHRRQGQVFKLVSTRTVEARPRIVVGSAADWQAALLQLEAQAILLPVKLRLDAVQPAIVVASSSLCVA